MEYLFKVWAEISLRLREAREILLLSDYDGTLTPIVERPELAELSEQTRQKLEALATSRRCSVGVISGRALSDLKHKVNLDGIIYAGNHGLDIEGPGIGFVNPVAEEFKPVARLLSQVLRKALGTIGGVFVEDKGLTLSVHYRLVDQGKAEDVRHIFERITAPARAMGRLRTTLGKKVYEVRPAVDWDKGKAVKMLLKKHHRRGRDSGLMVIFIGDDLTDEDGFKMVEKYGGISIFVGEDNPQSAARYFVKSPEEVERFLDSLLNICKGGVHAE